MDFTLSNIADICGILGFIISLFAIGGIIRINKRINSNKVRVSGTTTVSGDFTGRNKTTK